MLERQAQESLTEFAQSQSSTAATQATANRQTLLSDLNRDRDFQIGDALLKGIFLYNATTKQFAQPDVHPGTFVEKFFTDRLGPESVLVVQAFMDSWKQNYATHALFYLKSMTLTLLPMGFSIAREDNTPLTVTYDAQQQALVCRHRGRLLINGVLLSEYSETLTFKNTSVPPAPPAYKH
jgi:hypothetical protein